MSWLLICIPTGLFEEFFLVENVLLKGHIEEEWS